MQCVQLGVMDMVIERGRQRCVAGRQRCVVGRQRCVAGRQWRVPGLLLTAYRAVVMPGGEEVRQHVGLRVKRSRLSRGRRVTTSGELRYSTALLHVVNWSE